MQNPGSDAGVFVLPIELAEREYKSGKSDAAAIERTAIKHSVSARLPLRLN
jgi:hypothetical protein